MHDNVTAMPGHSDLHSAYLFRKHIQEDKAQPQYLSFDRTVGKTQNWTYYEKAALVLIGTLEPVDF